MTDPRMVKVPELTDPELNEIYEDFEAFLISRNGGGDKNLHPLNEDGERLCAPRPLHHADYRELGADTHPPGYYPICDWCIQRWRDEQ